jgi:hypothetical protein
LVPASAAGFQLLQCVSGSACGWGWVAAAPAAASSINILKEVGRPLYRLRQIKIPPSNGGMPSLSHIELKASKKADFVNT